MGAISCPVCRKYDGIRVQYGNGSTARWLFSGVDKDQNLVYSAVATTGQWSTLLVPERIYCARCDAKMPLDLLVLNPYIWKRR